MARRYLNLVYSICLREIGDTHLAEDATQAVFPRLPHKARVLPRATVPYAGLFHTTCLVAKNIRRRGRTGPGVGEGRASPAHRPSYAPAARAERPTPALLRGPDAARSGERAVHPPRR